jgi:hypothetical protein
MTDRSEYNKEYYSKDPERHRQRAKKWYDENKEKIDREKKRAYSRAYYAENKDTWNRRTREQQDAYNKVRRERYANDPEYRERQKDQSRNRPNKEEKKRHQHLKELYGLTHDQYTEKLASQNGVCAICGNGHSGRLNAKHLSVDHDHDTGMVRGLLCSKCNMGIGYFKENHEILQKAIDYLDKWRVKNEQRDKD